jgi:hypothetical protein
MPAVSKTDNIAQHLDDIDFRNHEERQKAWRKDFKVWYKDLWESARANPNDERIAGQLTMLSSVLWYLLEPKEYKALVRGKIYIDQTKFSPQQKKLFISMMAFKGSPYCDKTSARSVLTSYMQRAKPMYADIAIEENGLAKSIAHNIYASELTL